MMGIMERIIRALFLLAAFVFLYVMVCAQAGASDKDQRPTVYLLLVAVFSEDGRILSASHGPFHSKDTCMQRGVKEIESWAKKGAQDVTPVCVALYVPQGMVDELRLKDLGPVINALPPASGPHT